MPTIRIYGDPDDSRDDATLRAIIVRAAEVEWHVVGPPVVQRPNPGDPDRRPVVSIAAPAPGPSGPPGLAADFTLVLPPRNPPPPRNPGA